MKAAQAGAGVEELRVKEIEDGDEDEQIVDVL